MNIQRFGCIVGRRRDVSKKYTDTFREFTSSPKSKLVQLSYFL